MPTGIKRLCFCERGTMDYVKGGEQTFAAPSRNGNTAQMRTFRLDTFFVFVGSYFTRTKSNVAALFLVEI